MSRILKNLPVPAGDRTGDVFDLEASTLPRRYKIGLYRQAVQVYDIPNLYPVTYILFFAFIVLFYLFIFFSNYYYYFIFALMICLLKSVCKRVVK